MLELHTSNTANGQRAAIMLEECELPYSTRVYDLARGEHLAAGFVALNPVARIPVLVDRAGDDAALVVYGTQAIAQHLAERSGRLLPADPAARARVHTWAGVITSDLAPAYSGQFVFNVLAPDKLPWAIQYYDRLIDRLLGALDHQLARTPYLAGETYSYADVLAYPAAATSAVRYPGNLDAWPALAAWARRVGARPAVQRGMRIVA